MGMFDEIICEYPLPGVDVNIVFSGRFQTKSFENQMELYIIKDDGRIMHHGVRYESVPEEERPYFGTPEWKRGGLHKFCGAVRTVPTGDYYLDITETIRFYDSVNGEWFEFSATFIDGKLVDIRRVRTS
jgi:hypothetical protein